MNILKCLVIVALIATAIISLACKLDADNMVRVHQLEQTIDDSRASDARFALELAKGR